MGRMQNRSYESSSMSSDVDGEGDDECGIGVRVTQEKGRFKVAAIAEDGPAAATGELLVGDVLIQIEGVTKCHTPAGLILRTCGLRQLLPKIAAFQKSTGFVAGSVRKSKDITMYEERSPRQFAVLLAARSPFWRRVVPPSTVVPRSQETPTPHRTTRGPWAWPYCRVLGRGFYLRARYSCFL